MTKVEIGYVIISRELKQWNCKKEEETHGANDNYFNETLLVKSVTTESFLTALRSYVTNYLESSGIVNNSTNTITSSCNYTPSVHFSLETIETPMCMCSNLVKCTCNRSNVAASEKKKKKKSTVIAFSLVPYVLDNAGEFCESKALEEIQKNVYFSDNESCVPITLLSTMPLPTSVYIEEYDAYIIVIKTVKTINSSIEDGECIRSVGHSNGNTTKAILNTPLLMIGAGGIGCELLKVLVLYGFRQIHIIDLDTIDATNLNRQFLFTHEDIGESKAKMARRAVLKWFACTGEHNSHDLHCDFSESVKELPDIVAHHAQVQAPQFNEAFFAQFGCVLSALDNVKARQHVNRMCAKIHIPLIESGTMGYNGQVQPILYGKYECYDCRPKPPDTQTFAVCTIHARPTTMVHCVHFAKELYSTLFVSANDNEKEQNHTSEEEEEQHESDMQNTANEVDNSVQIDKEVHGNELSYLYKMLETCLSVESDKSNEASFEFSHQLASTLFHDKIRELLQMKSDWPTQAPTPIGLKLLNSIYSELLSTDTHSSFDYMSSTHRNTILCVEEELKRFMQSATSCALRLCAFRCNRQQSQSMEFSKNDELAVAFVAAVSNLRAANFHIPPQSLEEIRTIAGAIVPAIATTNAMVAAGVVRELLIVLEHNLSATHKINTDTNKLNTESLSMPLEQHEIKNQKDVCDKTSMGCTDKKHVEPEMLYIRKFAQTRRRTACLHNPFCVCSSASDMNHQSAEREKTELQTNATSSWTDNKTHAFNSYYRDQYVLHTAPLPLPNAQCPICQRLFPRIEVTLLHPKLSHLQTPQEEQEQHHECKHSYTVKQCMPLEEWTVEMFVEHVLHNTLGMDGVSITCNERIIFEEEEYEALSSHTLMSFANNIVVSSMSLTRESKRTKVDNNGCSSNDDDDVDNSTVSTTDSTPCLTFLIDALNKYVEWEVIVKQSTQCGTDIKQSFVIANMEEAEEIEAAAVKRVQEQQEQHEKEEGMHQDNNKDDSNEKVNAVNMADNANVVEIISDDEDDDCHDSTTAQKNKEDEGANEDEVMIIDD